MGALPRHFAFAIGVAALVLSVFSERPALAQLHVDASAEVGAMQRFFTNKTPGASNPGLGPTAQVSAHVALLPLVRAGVYLGHDISPLSGDATARDMTWGGVRAKIISPFPRGKLRPWLFVGFGYAGTYARSYHTNVALPVGVNETVTRDALVTGSGGGFFEVPFGLGASYKLWRSFSLVAELAFRVGFGHTGSVYEDPGRAFFAEGFGENRVLPAGLDRFAGALFVGAMFDL